MEFRPVGKVGVAWRTGLWKGRVSKRCSEEVTCVKGGCGFASDVIGEFIAGKCAKICMEVSTLAQFKTASLRTEAWFLLYFSFCPSRGEACLF